jgi:hypothetical protein
MPQADLSKSSCLSLHCTWNHLHVAWWRWGHDRIFKMVVSRQRSGSVTTGWSQHQRAVQLDVRGFMTCSSELALACCCGRQCIV